MNFLKHPLVILSFTLFSLLFSLSLYSNWRRHQAASVQVSQLESDVQKMNQEVTALQQATVTASGSGSIEKIIRDQLLMQKPGEQVLQLPDIENLPTKNQATPSPSSTPWQDWQQVFSK